MRRFEIRNAGFGRPVTRTIGPLLLSTLISCAAPILALAQSAGSAAIRGTVISTMVDGGQDVEVRLTNAKITVLSGSADVANVVTNQYGMFLTPRLSAGEYDVCAHAPGFVERCTRVRLGDELVYLENSIDLRPALPFLWGRITMLGGSPAARAGAAIDTTRGAARVSLEDGTGAIVAGPVTVALDGRYVLPGVKAGRDLILRARYDEALVQKPIDLTAGDLQGHEPINLVFSSDHPRISALQTTLNGAAIRDVAPGSTITITAKVADNSDSDLHFRWSSASGSQVFPDAPTVEWQVPKQAGPNTLHVEVTNRKGGFARSSINFDVGQLLDLKPVIDKPIFVLPSTIPCLTLHSCFLVNPATLGAVSSALASCCSFIDPLMTEFLSGCASLDSDAGCQAALQLEANAYYGTIGVYKPGTTSPDMSTAIGPAGRGSFSLWKTQNKFQATPSAQPGLQGGSVRAVYFNSHDLGFGRDMNCRDNSDNSQTWIACYVTNSADTGGPGILNDAQKSIDVAYKATAPIATVAIEFHSPALVPGQPITFFIYDAAGIPATKALLDTEGPKFLPRLMSVVSWRKLYLERDHPRGQQRQLPAIRRAAACLRASRARSA